MISLSMRAALLLGCLLVVVVHECQGSNPAMRHLLAVTKTATWPTTGNCTLTDPTKGCDLIIEDYTGNRDNSTKNAIKVRTKLLEIVAQIVLGTGTFSNLIGTDLCDTAAAYQKCIDKTATDCKSKASTKTDVKKRMRSSYLLSKFLLNKVCKSLKKQLGDVSFAKCYTSDTAKKDIIEYGKTVKSVFGKLADNGECNGAAWRKDMLVTKYENQGAIGKEKEFKDCKTKMTKMLNAFVRMFVRPDSSCDDKDFKEGGKREGGNPTEKQRFTSIMFSLNHIIPSTQKVNSAALSNLTTCQDETAVRNVTMLESEFFTVICEMVPNNDNGMSNTQCRMACLTFRDSNYDDVGTMCVRANSTFDKLERNFASGKKAKGGTLKKSIDCKGKSEKLKCKDPNTGLFAIVRKISYKHPSLARKYMLIIAVRASKTVMEKSSGRLAKVCDEIKDIAAAVTARRRKRATTSAVSAYDKKGTGDPAAGNFTAVAAAEGSEAEAEDSLFTGAAGRHMLLSLPLLSLTAVLVSAVAM